jgi:predicted nucleotidyltransferase
MVAPIAERRAELEALCVRFGVKRLDLFGSAAAEDAFDPATSDLDFIVEYPTGHDLGPWMRDYFAFRDAISTLCGRPVDLVMSSAMKNPHFIREANRARRTLYAR